MSPIGQGGGLQQIVALRQQIIDRSQLLKQLHTPEEANATLSDPASGFSGALQSALASVNKSQKNAQSLSEGYERGEVTDIAKVMLARQESGIAFEATLQVRNRLISAYQEIMRMGA